MDQSSSGSQSDRQGSNPSRGNRNRRRRRNPGKKDNYQSQSQSQGNGGQNRRSTKKKSQNRYPQKSGGHKGGGNSRDRRRQAPKPTLLERILSFLTFGLLGKSAPSRPKKKSRPLAQRTETRTPPMPAASSVPNPKRPSRTAVAEDVTGPRLYVGNLDYEANEGDLEQLFKGVGNVVSAEIVTNPRTQQSKGFGFVVMSHVDEARRAVTILHDQDFMGRKLLVSGARSEGPKSRDEEMDDDTETESGTGSTAISAVEPRRDPGETDSAAA